MLSKKEFIVGKPAKNDDPEEEEEEDDDNVVLVTKTKSGGVKFVVETEQAPVQRPVATVETVSELKSTSSIESAHSSGIAVLEKTTELKNFVVALPVHALAKTEELSENITKVEEHNTLPAISKFVDNLFEQAEKEAGKVLSIDQTITKPVCEVSFVAKTEQVENREPESFVYQSKSHHIVADQVAQEAMYKAFQDITNSGADFPQQSQPSPPLAPPQVVSLHRQPSPQQMQPIATPQVFVSDGNLQLGPQLDPISHQKLADQVAQRAIRNYNAQQEHQPTKEVAFNNQMVSNNGGQQSTKPAQPERQGRHQADNTPVLSHHMVSSRFQQPQHVPPKPVPQAAPPLPQPQPTFKSYSTTHSRDQSRDRCHDSTSWIAQESVSANQIVKGAPWAQHKVDRHERVWPPPPPKMVPLPYNEPNVFEYTTERSESHAYAPPQQLPPPASSGYQSQTSFQSQVSANRNAIPLAPMAPTLGQSYQPSQQISIARTPSPFRSQESQAQRFDAVCSSEFRRPAGQSANNYAHFSSSNSSFQFQPPPAPQQQRCETAPHHQPSTLEFQAPVYSKTFADSTTYSNPQQTIRRPQPVYVSPSQPLSLDTGMGGSSDCGFEYNRQQYSPRTLYRGTGPYDPQQVSMAVPPQHSPTCTPVLPFVKQPERQDFEKFETLYSPGRLVAGPVRPESHGFVSSQVASVPGGTSFARVHNTSRLAVDAATGQPYKENVQRTVRTTRTVPKWK